jgi:Fe(3+) dicitrate transport protein
MRRSTKAWRTFSLVVPLAAASVAAADDPPAPTQAKQEAERLAEKSDASMPAPGEIVVTAAGGGVPLTYAGGRDVIESDTLQRYPDGNIATALRRVPGVVLLPENGNDSRLNIGLRGSDARRSGLTTVLVDGVPICEAPYGNTDVDGLPVSFERIARIDVIRGGAAIRWGPNSAGGLINLVTEDIPDHQMARFGVRFGSDDDLSLSTAVGGTWDQFGALFNVVRKGGDGYRDNSEYTDYDLAAKFRFVFDDRNTLNVSISHFQELDAEQPGGLTQAAYDDDPWQSLRPGFDFRYQMSVYKADFVHRISDESQFQIIGWYYNGFRGLFDYRPVVGPYSSRRNQNSDFSASAVEARFTWTTELAGMKHSFFHSARYLVEKNRELYESIPFGSPPSRPYPLDAVFSGDALSVFTEDTIDLTDRLALALGARSESIDMNSRSRDDTQPVAERSRHYTEILPTASLTWTFLTDAALYASYQENFLTPQYETGFDPASAAYRPVDAEHSNTREVGARVRAVEGLEVTGALFKTLYSDKLDYQNLPNGDKIAVNSGRAQSHGVEFGTAYDFGALREELKGLSAYATVTRLNSTIESGVNDGHDTPNSPRKLASWGVMYEHCSGVWARVGGSHTGSSYKDPENYEDGNPEGNTGPVPSFTLWDAAIGWRENPDGEGFSVTVGVTNLFDEAYYRRFSTGIYPGAPRQFFVSGSYTLSW